MDILSANMLFPNEDFAIVPLHWDDIFSGYQIACVLKRMIFLFSLKLHLKYFTFGSF